MNIQEHKQLAIEYGSFVCPIGCEEDILDDEEFEDNDIWYCHYCETKFRLEVLIAEEAENKGKDVSLPQKRLPGFIYTCVVCEKSNLDHNELQVCIEKHVRNKEVEPHDLPLVFMPDNLTKDDWSSILISLDEAFRQWNKENEHANISLSINIDESIKEYDTDE